MSRLNLVTQESAVGAVQQSYQALQSQLGFVPNMAQAMANSPAASAAYAQLNAAVSRGQLRPRLREQITLAVSQANHCDYCLAAHSAIGRKLGLTDEQIQNARRGASSDPKTDALLRFATQVVERRGQVSDNELQAFRDAGYDDAAVAEVVVNVALSILTNYFNNVAQPEIDFPAAEPLAELAQAAH